MRRKDKQIFLEEFFKEWHKRLRTVKNRIFLTGIPQSGSPSTSQRFPMIFMGATRKLTKQGCPVTSLCKWRAAHAKIAIPHCSSYLWLPRKLTQNILTSSSNLLFYFPIMCIRNSGWVWLGDLSILYVSHRDHLVTSGWTGLESPRYLILCVCCLARDGWKAELTWSTRALVA